MRKYRDEFEPRRDYFGQGFRMGLLFGILGALIVLGQRPSVPPAAD